MEHMLWFVKNEIFQEAILVIGKTTEYNCQKKKNKIWKQNHRDDQLCNSPTVALLQKKNV